MTEFQEFLTTYGWQLGLIALAGVILLGILKYSNAFSKIEKGKRKPIYFAITMGFSLIATVIYLLCIKQFEVGFLVTITIAIYGLNQTFYAIYETTKLRDLLTKILDFIKEKLTKKTTKDSDTK